MNTPQAPWIQERVQKGIDEAVSAFSFASRMDTDIVGWDKDYSFYRLLADSVVRENITSSDRTNMLLAPSTWDDIWYFTPTNENI